MKQNNLAIGMLIAAIGVSGQAGASLQQRSSFQGAVNNCQAARPSFEGALRKRPLGIANEGGSSAFVSCALAAQTSNTSGINRLLVFLVNRGAAAVDVSCTLIDGLSSPFGVPVFLPKVFTLISGQPTIVGWDSVNDNGGIFFSTPSMSCAIPPGVEINATKIFYDIDIGA